MKKTSLILIALFAALQFSYAQFAPMTGAPGNYYYNNGAIFIGPDWDTGNKFYVGGSGHLVNFSNMEDQDIEFLLSAPFATDKYALIAPSTATNLTFGTSSVEKMRLTDLGRLGIGTTNPTHTLTLPSSSTGIALYNTVDQTTNYERFLTQVQNNALTFGSYASGTGTARSLQFGVQAGNGTTTLSGGRIFSINLNAIGGTAGVFDFAVNTASAAGITTLRGGYSASTGTQSIVAIVPTYNQTSSAGNRSLWISPFLSTTGSGSQYLIDAGTNSAANGGGTHTSKFVVTNAGYVGINTANPQEALSVNGNIRAKRVKVETTGWPDFVFRKGYKLPSLASVNAYIQKNHHLPDMPAAKEVHTDGQDLGEINKLLLKKVEELTLYLIKKDEQFNKLKKEQRERNDGQQAQLEELKAAVSALKAQYNK